MTQKERRIYLIDRLLSEDEQYNGITIPESEAEQKRLLRSLINIRLPSPIGNDFLEVINISSVTPSEKDALAYQFASAKRQRIRKTAFISVFTAKSGYFLFQ